MYSLNELFRHGIDANNNATGNEKKDNATGNEKKDNATSNEKKDNANTNINGTGNTFSNKRCINLLLMKIDLQRSKAERLHKKKMDEFIGEIHRILSPHR